jgi:radical SAM protein with 4Fe4S-binding SPASM domain
VAMIFKNEFNVIYVRVVQSCNLNCTHCFTNGNRDKFQLASLKDIELYLMAIKENVDPRKAVFYIHGGETFLAPLEYLKQVNDLIRKIFTKIEFHIIPQTNLLFKVDDEFVAFVREEYSSEMGISWDYKIRFDDSKKSLSEERFLKNLGILLEAGVNVAISITVQRHLLEMNYLELLEKFDGVKSIDFELLTIFDDKTQDLKVSNIKWSIYLKSIVDYYLENDTSWSLPQIDLFTKSILENKLYRCKCDCCNNRTFTLNPNGTVGLCPDTTYYRPVSTAREMFDNWKRFQEKALPVIALRESLKVNKVCLKCEFYDICGGNCEESLFVEGEDECPLSKSVVKYQLENLPKFSKKLDKAYSNLPEL